MRMRTRAAAIGDAVTRQHGGSGSNREGGKTVMYRLMVKYYLLGTGGFGGWAKV